MLLVTCIVRRTLTLFLIFQSQMICIRGDCGLPPLIEHTLPVTETSGVEGDEILYSCNHTAGYYEVPGKGRTITCQLDTWTEAFDFCARACGFPEGLDFASPKDSDLKLIYPPGTKVSYDCRLGYRRVPFSDNSIICLENYTWSIPSEFCTRRECGSPGETANGEFEATNGFLFGSKVTYKCNEGFRLSSKRPFRDCQADGKWTNTVPQCEVVLCTAPDSPVNGMYNPVKDEYTFQDAVTFECNKGLHVIGVSTAACTSDGTWSASSPTCKDISCVDPGRIQNGMRKSGFAGPYTLNSAVRYECDINFVMNGSSSIICNIHSQWEPELPQCLTVCETPPTSKSAVLEERFANLNYFDKTTVLFKCKPGYLTKPEMENRITCIGRSWSKLAEFCSPISCGDPGEVRNARRLDSTLTFESKVQYECLDGHVFTTSTTYKECQADGKWTSGEIICTVTCQIQSIANSNVTSKSEHVENTSVIIKCLQGFALLGEDVITCNLGKWHPSLPQCIVPPQQGLDTAARIAIGVVVGIFVCAIVAAGLVWVCKSKKSGKPNSDTPDVHYVACNDA